MSSSDLLEENHYILENTNNNFSHIINNRFEPKPNVNNEQNTNNITDTICSSEQEHNNTGTIPI